MDFMGKMQQNLSKGIATSRELYGKAKEKAKEVGERGLIHLEISQLQQQLEAHLGQLGLRAYELFLKDEAAKLGLASPGVQELVSEITRIKGEIEERKKALKRLT